ncbi:MAG TPA: hypothetical protein VN643_04630 [Pyrinomonadaceae bacterium]|nr:hypothetical protein [Pyrinomonadaceae bacterium]
MQLDIRLPIGLMFLLLGLVLAVFGLVGDKSQYKSSLGINVNLWWGLVMLGFGLVMFLLGRRGSATARLTEDSPEGVKLEEKEAERAAES